MRRPGPLFDQSATRLGHGPEIETPETPAERPLEPPLEHRLDQRPDGQTIPCRHQMDRRAHQRDTDEASLQKQATQLVVAEPLEPAPETDVWGGGNLRLHPAEPLGGGGDAEAGAAEEQLASQQGPIERAKTQDLRRCSTLNRAGVRGGIGLQAPGPPRAPPRTRRSSRAES